MKRTSPTGNFIRVIALLLLCALLAGCTRQADGEQPPSDISEKQKESEPVLQPDGVLKKWSQHARDQEYTVGYPDHPVVELGRAVDWTLTSLYPGYDTHVSILQKFTRSFLEPYWQEDEERSFAITETRDMVFILTEIDPHSPWSYALGEEAQLFDLTIEFYMRYEGYYHGYGYSELLPEGAWIREGLQCAVAHQEDQWRFMNRCVSSLDDMRVSTSVNARAMGLESIQEIAADLVEQYLEEASRREEGRSFRILDYRDLEINVSGKGCERELVYGEYPVPENSWVLSFSARVKYEGSMGSLGWYPEQQDGQDGYYEMPMFDRLIVKEGDLYTIPLECYEIPPDVDL